VAELRPQAGDQDTSAPHGDDLRAKRPAQAPAPIPQNLNPNKLLRQIMRAAADGPLTNRRVRELTGLNREQVRAVLLYLVDQRRLVRHGKKRDTRYVLRPR
jgi:predicted HTH transcriptional regulator